MNWLSFGWSIKINKSVHWQWLGVKDEKVWWSCDFVSWEEYHFINKVIVELFCQIINWKMLFFVWVISWRWLPYKMTIFYHLYLLLSLHCIRTDWLGLKLSINRLYVKYHCKRNLSGVLCYKYKVKLVHHY